MLLPGALNGPFYGRVSLDWLVVVRVPVMCESVCVLLLGWGPRTCVSNSSLPFPYDSLWSIIITWSARFKLLGGDSSHGVFRRVFEGGSLGF